MTDVHPHATEPARHRPPLVVRALAGIVAVPIYAFVLLVAWALMTRDDLEARLWPHLRSP